MKVQYSDLMNRSSYVMALLNKLSDERKILEKRANRLRALDIAIVNAIQDGRITNTDEIERACVWLNHSDLEIWEIIDKVLEK